MEKKEKVEEWALKLYPSIWRQLIELGRRKTKDGEMMFEIERDLEA